MTDMAPVTSMMNKWLIETYKCVAVPYGSMPPTPEEYDLPEGRYMVLASKQIDIKQELPIKEAHYSSIEKEISKTVEKFKFKIAEELLEYGIKPGDDLYVREWPMFMCDEAAFRQGKFGYYGWVEVFCIPIEVGD